MLNNWIKPVSLEQITGQVHPIPQTWGARISFQMSTDVQLAIIGVGESDANEVRRALYALSFPFEHLNVADLGNMRNLDPAFLIAPLREIIQSNIMPVFIGQDVSLINGYYRAFLALQDWISLALIDQILREAICKDILMDADAKLFHLSMIGCQSHAMLPDQFQFLESRYFDLIRLGEAKSQLQSVEPLIRDADLVAFNVNAISYPYAPGQISPSPSGFSTDEACQISRYIGMSDKVKAMGIFGYRHEYDVQAQTAQLIAQMIWYATEGFYNRTGDFPASTQGLTEYLVEVKSVNLPVCFWKSTRSGRWWMEVVAKEVPGMPIRHRLIPCTYQDYRSACNDELPDRLIQAFKRFA
jgi:formiminoglutamase